VTLLRLRDRYAFTGFAGANLVFGAYDLSFTPSTRSWGERNLVLNQSAMEWFVENFAPLPAEERRSPDISPLFADLANLPPALFSVGTLDPLLDDSLFMYARWVAAGNRAELAIYPGAVHGFTAYPLGMTRRANARCYGFLVEAVNAPA
jgi:acetyl esterase/lipase